MRIGYSILLFFTLSLLITSCQTGSDNKPAITFDNYKIADGFDIQLAASEPLIEAPVAMDFDNQGRISASPKLFYGLKSVSSEEIKNLRDKKSGTLQKRIY
ncbi:MAG TPA: hypothetical protein VIM07_12465 [Chitinophagaceae bacterium]